MDELVIGATIGSLRYSFINDIPIVYVRPQPPHQFSGELAEFHKLYFCLALAGKILNANTVQSMRVLEDGLKVISSHSSVCISAKKYTLFDSHGVEGIPSSVTSEKNKYEVLDWIDVRSGTKHEHEIIQNDSDFINSINFYPSHRPEVNSFMKDVCVISYLTGEQLNSFEFSELVVRIKAQEAMERVGITGASNGAGKRLSIRLESNKRQVLPQSKPTYKSLPDKFFSGQEIQNLKMHSRSDYLNSLYSAWTSHD